MIYPRHYWCGHWKGSPRMPYAYCPACDAEASRDIFHACVRTASVLILILATLLVAVSGGCS